jgi:hypothetical protein
METKICKICGEEKSKDDFYIGNAKCKSCKISYQREYTQKNKDSIIQYKREYHQKNIESIHKKSKDYYEMNKEYVKDKSKEYYSNNRDKKISYQKEYASNNKERRNRHHLNRIKTDSLYRLRSAISKMTNQTFKRRGYTKSKKSLDILGCDIDFLLNYIELKFETWMDWGNYGLYNGELNFGWDIDHIKPLSSAQTEDEIYILSHYSNLQPLDSKINRDIKRDNIL